ncbi:MAG: hypothetical protein MI924_26565 [Chloroflexales bacterium]|nr:hypothetical protein [Chloroflexales bacterium]
MQQLINFSIYPLHTRLFDNDWQAVAAFAKGCGLDGIELLIGDQPPPDLPTGLVRGVHLPYWIRWLDIWRDGAAATISADERHFLAGAARDATHMVELQHTIWQRAAALRPHYAVFHVSHVTMEHAFTGAFTYSSAEVIAASADLLNAVAATFPNGEPPVRLWLENLFCSPRCREIVAALQPAVLVHEFVIASRDDMRARLEEQQTALEGAKQLECKADWMNATERHLRDPEVQ